jgi:hypothetical protein
MADQTNIIPLNPNSFSSEVYSPQDESLIGSSIEQNQFDINTDYVEYFIFDLNNNKISPSGNDATFTDYTILDNEIYVNPETDVLNRDIDTGTVNSLYNFYRKWANSSPQSTYYISEISSDRTEIRLDSNLISREEIITSIGQFVAYRETDETFPDFYINLGSNILFIANNIKLDTDNTVLIKLYEPLPANITLKTSLWIVEKISAGLAYQVKFENAQLTPRTFPQLAGPNINLPIKGQLNNSTEEISLSDLSSPNSQSEYQINSYFDDPSIQINVDYSDYSNFVNYSSAKNRIENFWYKVSLIESASEQISFQNTLTSNPATSASITPLNTLINETITNFDNYEYYLYFESSSDTYPKVSSTPPYQNESTGSIAAQNWYVAKISSSEDYDRENQNWLQYASPQFIQDDSANDQYMTFLNMIGHFVDNDIWVYLKDTTNKWDADNRINAGVSKDLVAQVLRDMGVKLYQNNFSSTDLYSAFLGFTDSGSLFPFPYMTGSLPTPSGYEYISNFISSSDEAIPLDDINKRIYKRIYHNLPYLLKSKGTVAGLRTLINSYGIPDTILRISEFGGKDRNNVNDWDLWKHQYNYKTIKTSIRGLISTNWLLNSAWQSQDQKPQTLQFRFNAGLPSGSFGIVEASQSLWMLDRDAAIVLEYNTDLAEIPTADTYSGSIVDPTYQYATLKFTPDNFNSVASVTLPFLDGGWWNVSVTREDSNFTLFAGNKIYSGSDGSQIGFYATSSLTSVSPQNWVFGTNSYFPSRNGLSTTFALARTYQALSGSYQEIRYFSTPLTENVFKDYVMNPQSTEGNGINGSADQLAFRASLGGELYTGSVSIHPKVSGPTGYPTSSFSANSNFTLSDIEFNTNREWVFYDSPAVGIKNRNTDKIKRQDLVLPSGDTLSNQKSIQQKSYTTDDYTNNLNLLEVAFSPQNQINDDIISQIGHFNIGDYIGDPRLVSSSANTYPSLVDLSKEYFEKYTSSYDVYDYIRLIKFFDNSLFKMVKDFVPSRTGLASGIVVKQHILERQKYPTPQAEWTRPEYTGSIGSTPALLDGARYYEASTDYESNPIETISGSDGGTFLSGYVTQSWDGINVTPLGDVPFTQDNKEEFIDGEFSGSVITVTNGELNPECDTFKKADTTEIQYYLSSSVPENTYDFINTPGPGAAYTMMDTATNDGLKIYLQWAFDRTSQAPLSPTRKYFWNVVGFAIKIPESANAVEVEDYITSLKELKLLDVNFVGSDVPSLPGWVGVSNKTFTNAVDPVLIPKSFRRYNAYANSGRFIYVETEPSEMEFSFNFNVLSGTVGDLYGFDIASKGLINTVFEPFIPQTFQNSDCNPLINNATDITPSLVYYDVDYANNPNVAVNFGAIMSGSAPKAKIQDFNYHSNRSIIPRYSGSRNTSNDYNVLNGAIDATQAYFAYFNYVGGTAPEWGNGIADRSGINVRFFIDVNGNIIKPIADSQGINQRTVENNFTEGKIATVAFDDASGSSAAFANLLGDHTIFKSGKDITPIIYSQTASIAPGETGGYTSSLEFVENDAPSAALDYRLTATSDTGIPPGYLQITGDGPLAFATIAYQAPNAAIQTTGGVTWAYKPNLSPSVDGVTLNITATISNAFGNFATTLDIQLYKNGNPVGAPTPCDWTSAPAGTAFSVSYSDPSASAGDLYQLKVTNFSGVNVTLENSSFFDVNQSPLPALGPAGPNFFEKSNRTLSLHSSFNSYYGLKQVDIKNTGFFGITNPFTIQVGDEIRFQGTEEQAYQVVEVYENTNPKSFLLDRYISAANLNWFLVRRYVDNPANIILEVDKPAGGTSPGILKPQYLSRNAEDNIDTILENLRRDALI